MHEKANELCDSFVARGIGRRELARRLAARGFVAGAADMLVNAAATKALAADFDWKAHQGTSQMVQDSGPKNWATYTWYPVNADLGAGASGMIYDADSLGYFANSGDTKMKGHLAYAPLAPNPDAKGPTSNVWIWSLAMSNFSRRKDAAWTFLQWATGTDHLLFGARGKDQIDPVSASIWEDADFTARVKANFPNFAQTYQATEPGAKIYFTPQPLFFNVTTNWAASLQQMVAKQVPVNEGLDKLADGINRQMRQAGLA